MDFFGFFPMIKKKTFSERHWIFIGFEPPTKLQSLYQAKPLSYHVNKCLNFHEKTHNYSNPKKKIKKNEQTILRLFIKSTANILMNFD
jgi:hypothetical protein